VCALCHQNDEGKWNYEDFGVYEKSKKYLSNCIFCSGGTNNTCRISIGKQVSSDKYIVLETNKWLIQTKGDLIQSSEYIEVPTVVTTTPGKLYQGEGL
jgi:hypothetical protein